MSYTEQDASERDTSTEHDALRSEPEIDGRRRHNGARSCEGVSTPSRTRSRARVDKTRDEKDRVEGLSEAIKSVRDEHRLETVERLVREQSNEIGRLTEELKSLREEHALAVDRIVEPHAVVSGRIGGDANGHQGASHGKDVEHAAAAADDTAVRAPATEPPAAEEEEEEDDDDEKPESIMALCIEHAVRPPPNAGASLRSTLQFLRVQLMGLVSTLCQLILSHGFLDASCGTHGSHSADQLSPRHACPLLTGLLTGAPCTHRVYALVLMHLC
jgi:hypothetical protein